MALRSAAHHSAGSRASLKALSPLLQPGGVCPSHRRLRSSAPYSQQQQQQLQRPWRSGVRAQVAGPVTSVPSEASAAPAVSTQAKLVFFGFCAMCISNMDKVNISIAIIPIAQELGWGSAEMGLIQSSFFAGYLLMNLPGGYLASRLGGRRTLPIGLAVWSAATALTPLASATAGFGLSRAMVGLGQAVAPTSVVDMMARTVKKEERASSVSLAFSGLHAGSIVGLLAAPLIIETAGWRSLFMLFGAAGLIWYLAFEAFMQDVYKNDPEVAAKLTASMTASAQGKPDTPIPYRAFVRSRPVQALCLTHFANNWLHYSMLAWLPSYFSAVLQLEDLGAAAHTSIFPPLAGMVCSVLAGPTADNLISQGVPLPYVRKLMQALASLGPAACLLAASINSSGDGNLVVPLVTLALGLSSFSLAGLYCTHGDMSPKYAGAMLGLTNTSGAIAGVISVSAVGVLKELTHSWEAALIIPNIAILSGGGLGYIFICKNAAIDFDAADNSPFAFEQYLEGPKRMVAAAAAAAHTVFARLERLVPQPPKEAVQAARRTRLIKERSIALASAAATAVSIDAQSATAFASTSQTAASSSASSSTTPSFASLVTSSLGGFHESVGPNSSTSNAMLVSHWTVASMIPDYGPESQEDHEMSDAEEEVARIMEQMRLDAGLAAGTQVDVDSILAQMSLEDSQEAAGKQQEGRSLQG